MITTADLKAQTRRELADLARNYGVPGWHGMKKDELLVAIKDARGIKDAPVKKADASIADVKKKIKVLKARRQAAIEAKDSKLATICKRQISRLKKKTRRAA